ncbi:MAG: S8 family serine peptidase [candidate division WOR-3 bacterium]
MKIFLKIFPLIIFFNIFSLDLSKLDPTLLSYFSEDLGQQIFLSESREKIIFDISHTDSIFSYNYQFQKNTKSQIPVILKGDVNKLKTFLFESVVISDSLITGYIDFSQLKVLSDSNFLNFCEISKPIFQSSDSGAYWTRISQMVDMGYDGEGVNIGFIDEGFLPSLDIFKKDNFSKFKLIWNQKGFSPFPPENFGYGEEIDSLNVLNCNIEDVKGHGTSLLSILSSESYFSEGLIKKSKIIAVNTYLNTKNVLDGLKYLVQKCEYFKKPFVVFMPLTYYWGFHNGQDLFEEGIKKLFPLTETKRGISVPAGNLGNLKIHAKVYDNYSIKNDDILSNSSVLILTDSSKNLDIDISNDNDLSIRFFVVSDGSLLFSDWIDLKDTPVFYCYGKDFFLGFGFNDEKNFSHLLFEHQNKSYLVIQIFKTLKENPVEFFISRGGTFVKPSYDNFFDGDRKKTLCSPALIENVISSGSYLSRRNTYLFVSEDTLFTISSFNSKSEDNLKPDIYSPGKYILSYKFGSDGIGYKDSFGFFLGTSYSSIFTGVALVQLLQADSNLNVNQLYELIKKGADIVSVDRDYELFTGYGFLNVFRSLRSQSVRADQVVFSIEKNQNFVKIILNDINYRILECVNKTLSKKVEVYNNFSIDRTPKIGKNIYNLKLLSYGGETKEMDIEVEISKFTFLNKHEIYDLTGRKVVEGVLKRGVYFKKLEGEKIKKIVKF